MKGDASAETNLEVEWQFDASDLDAVARWLSEPREDGYLVTSGPIRSLHDTYYDTPDWRVHDAGFTCRVRREPNGAELTLKSMAPASGDGIRSRHEYNEPLPSGRTEPNNATGACAQMLDELGARPTLAVLFEIKTQRRTFILSDAGGQLAELALDSTTAHPSSASATVSRVEVEVDASALERTRPFVDHLVHSLGLSRGATSKFAFGLAASGKLMPSHRGSARTASSETGTNGPRTTG